MNRRVKVEFRMEAVLTFSGGPYDGAVIDADLFGAGRAFPPSVIVPVGRRSLSHYDLDRDAACYRFVRIDAVAAVSAVGFATPF